jgi:tRNA threonylcarbamoyladenosine biosynthesis protein TsaE
MEWVLTLNRMQLVAREFWNFFEDKKIFAFQGSIGSGKTTFIRALCEAKQVSSTIGSPSFYIINEYVYPDGKIFHVDLYRLKDAEEVIRAGVEDCFFSGDICLVEWPEKAPGIFPPETVYISVNTVDRETRKIHSEASSQTRSNSI